MTDYKMHLLICGGTGCKASESDVIKERLIQLIEDLNLDEEVQVVSTGCFGFCEKGRITSYNVCYTKLLRLLPKQAR